jgi:hypothetical protein
MGNLIALLFMLCWGFFNVVLLEEMGDKAWGFWIILSGLFFRIILLYFGV